MKLRTEEYLKENKESTETKKQDNPLVEAIVSILWVLFIAWGAVHLAFLALDIGLPRVARPISFTVFALCYLSISIYSFYKDYEKNKDRDKNKALGILLIRGYKEYKEAKDKDKNKNLRISLYNRYKEYKEYKEYEKKYKSSVSDRIESVVYYVVIYIFLGTVFFQTFEDDPNRVFVEDYATALRIIDAHYIYEIDLEEMHQQVMRALASELDEWSRYIAPVNYESFSQRLGNSFSGIGVQLLENPELGGMEITKTFCGSPAEIGGLLIGDIITYIDDRSVYGFSNADIRELLKRPLGDYAEITVIRGDEEMLQLTIMYGEIFVDPIEYKMLEGNIGYISISNFGDDSGNSFVSAVEKLIDMGAESFIYDVRLNRGGWRHENNTMLNFLLPEGGIYVEMRRGGENIVMSDEYWLDMPAVVLVNRYSASASEIFAMALSEHDYAIVVGEQTRGKFSSQPAHRLPGGGALSITTSKILTMNRVYLGYERVGLMPDFIIEHTDEELALLEMGDLDFENDPQMQKAIKILSGIQ